MPMCEADDLPSLFHHSVMNYLCGKDCPSGDKCTNRSLASRQQAPYRVFFVRITLLRRSPKVLRIGLIFVVAARPDWETRFRIASYDNDQEGRFHHGLSGRGGCLLFEIEIIRADFNCIPRTGIRSSI